MRATRSRLLAPATVAGAFLLAGCELPGSTYGMYSIEAKLTSNTCGSGLGAPNPWTFEVQLSTTGNTLFWSWLDASPLLSGPLSEGHAKLTNFQVQNVDTLEGGVMGPCDLQRNDAIDLTLAPGSPPSTFGGDLSYSFSIQEGANCSDQLSASGGTYATLPCGVSYTFSGMRD